MKRPPRLYLVLDDPRFFRPFMTDFFKVMRNHRVACVLTMQQEEQWDLLDLPAMKNVIRGLLAFKMYYRPETLETGERMALVLKRYDAMGDTRPYATKARQEHVSEGRAVTDGVAETEGDSYSMGSVDGDAANGSEGWQIVPRVDDFGGMAYDTRFPIRSGGTGHGQSHSDSLAWGTSSARTTSRATTLSAAKGRGASETEHLHIVGVRDQVLGTAQTLLSDGMHRHDALVRWEDEGTPKSALVHVKPAPRLSAYRDGRPVLAQYRAAVAKYTKRSVRPPYVPAALPAAIPAIEPAVVEPPEAQERRTRDPLVFPARAADLTSRAMKRLAALDVVASVRLCSVQQLMMLLGFSYDQAHRELDGLADAGLIDRIRRTGPRGNGSLPLGFVLNGAGATLLSEHGRGGEELQRIAKNMRVHRRAVEQGLPTQDRHRTLASTLLSVLVAAIRRVDPEARVSAIAFDRERTFPVDLAPFEIPPRERALISPDPTKTTVSYVPDFFFEVEWKRDGQLRKEPVFGEVETGFGERRAEDLAIGKAWKIRALLHAYERTHALGEQVYAPGTIPRFVIWSRTPALEQGFFDGARAVFREAKSPLWLTHGEILPLAVPAGTKKKEIGSAVAGLVGNVQRPVWRWLRFPDPNDRRRFLATREPR